MAVALNVDGTAISGATSPVASSTSINVGAAATCLFISVIADDSTISVTAPTWNGVSSTLIGTVNTTDTACLVRLYGLVNPASGSNSLSVSWTGGAPSNVTLHAASFTCSVTSSVASCFTGFTSQANDTAGTSQSITVTSATGDISVAASNANNAGLNSLTATSSTALYNSGSFGASRAPGAATVAWTGALSASVTNCISGCDIVASTAVATPFKPQAAVDLPSRGYIYSEWYRWLEEGNVNIPTRDLTKPQKQTDWPNPRAYSRLVDYTWIEPGNVILPIRDLTKPTLLRDFPNPYRTTWYRSVEVSGNALTGVVQNPFSRTDWPNPPRVTWYQSWTQSFQQTIPFKQSDWPVPKTSQLLLQTWSQSLNTFYQSETFPFVQSDYPNPQRITWDRFWSQSPAPVTPGTPFFQSDWPLPGQQPVFLQTQIYSTLVNIPPVQPFNQRDWPNSQRIVWDRFWSQSPAQSTPTPFFQNVDFPLPTVSQPIDQTWIQNLAPFFQSNTFPFSQTDWKNPYLVYWYRDHNQNLVINLPVGLKPFGQSDWPVPVGYPQQPSVFISPSLVQVPQPPTPPLVIFSSGRQLTERDVLRSWMAAIGEKGRAIRYLPLN